MFDPQNIQLKDIAKIVALSTAAISEAFDGVNDNTSNLREDIKQIKLQLIAVQGHLKQLVDSPESKAEAIWATRKTVGDLFLSFLLFFDSSSLSPSFLHALHYKHVLPSFPSFGSFVTKILISSSLLT